MSEHALLSPSSAGQWYYCPGSVQLQQKYPDDGSSSESEEGDRAHQLAYDALIAGQLTVVGDDDEMSEGVQLYLDHVRSFNLPLYPEYRVKSPEIHPEHCWGTVDCWAYDPEKMVLRVFDFKYGHGFVEEVENKQLITYVNGLLTEIGVTGLTDQKITVVMTIVQPRCYGHDSIRTWSCKASDLRAIFNKLRGAGEEALSDNPTTRAGSHCQHCSGRHVCSTLNKASLSAMDLIESIGILDIQPDVLGKQFDEMKRIESIFKAKLTGLEEQVKSTCASGGRVTGWTVESVPGNLKWKHDVDTIVMKLGAKVMKLGLITPTQAKKVIDESVINEYSERQSSLKLVKDDMKKSSKAFGNQ